MFTSLNKPARTASRLAAFTLAALLGACGGGGGNHQAPVPPPAQPSHPEGGHGPTYDVIPLGMPDVYGNITRQGIANGGIVAGTTYGGPDGVGRAFLYNGSTEVALGTLGGTFSQALAVNRCGRVTGASARADGRAHAFLYDGSMHDLGTLGGAESVGNAINSCGKITGWAVTASGQSHAFLYDGTTMQDLGTFGGNRSEGQAINKVGQITGFAAGPGNAWYHAFLYDSRTGGPLQDLGSLGDNSFAVDINDAGQVTGIWYNNGEPIVPRRSFYYEAGNMRDIGTLGGRNAVAVDINEAGLVTGGSNLANGEERGFVYDGKTMSSIGTLVNHRLSYAAAINASGLVVGYSSTGDSSLAISWTRKDGIVDLNTRLHAPPPGLVLTEALAVADDGNIAVRTNHGLALLKLRH